MVISKSGTDQVDDEGFTLVSKRHLGEKISKNDNMVETYNTNVKDLAVEDFSQDRNSKGDVELNNHTLAQKEMEIVESSWWEKLAEIE